MADSTSSRRRTYSPGSDENSAPEQRRTRGKPDWVQPHLLLGLALVLVVITTLVVAIRGSSRRTHPAKAPGTPAEPSAVRTGGLREGALIPPRPVVSGRPDEGDAREFHGKFAERLSPALRRIGFRPGLIGRSVGQAGTPDRWTVHVPTNFPVLRVNAEVTLLARKLEGRVYLAAQDSLDLALVTLYVGAGNVVTDEVLLRRERRLKFKGNLAFIIDDVGYRSAASTMEFVRLPQALTLAVLPGQRTGAEVAQKAIEAGKDVIVHLPMEPSGVATGLEPNTIMTSMSDGVIRDLTMRHIDSVPGVIGVNNHMGSKATEDARVMRVVLGVLRERGLFFIDSRTSSNTIAESTAQETGVLSGRRHVFLDNDHTTPKIIQEIRNAAALAAREGNAIAIGHDRSETYAAMAQALPRLEEEGYRICPVSELLR